MTWDVMSSVGQGVVRRVGSVEVGWVGVCVVCVCVCVLVRLFVLFLERAP